MLACPSEAMQKIAELEHSKTSMQHELLASRIAISRLRDALADGKKGCQSRALDL